MLMYELCCAVRECERSVKPSFVGGNFRRWVWAHKILMGEGEKERRQAAFIPTSRISHSGLSWGLGRASGTWLRNKCI